MLVHEYAHGYSRKKKHITGRGFVDSLSSVFNSMKASVVPVVKSIGSYVSNNKDLIAKPLLGAVGSLAATGLTTGVPALLSHIMKRKQVTVDDPKYKELVQSLTQPTAALTSNPLKVQPPVTNIIGSGVRRSRPNRRWRGAGIKKF